MGRFGFTVNLVSYKSRLILQCTIVLCSKKHASAPECKSHTKPSFCGLPDTLHSVLSTLPFSTDCTSSRECDLRVKAIGNVV